MQETIVDKAALKDLEEIMGEDFNQLLETFVQDSVERIAKLTKAVQEKDSEQIRSIAHGFKGSALNLSAIELTEYCRQLEIIGRENRLDQAADVLHKVDDAFAKVRQFFAL